MIILIFLWGYMILPIFCQIYGNGSDLSLMFLAEVFQQIAWKDILQSLCERRTPEEVEVTNQMVSSLLNLLIIFANQMSLTQTEVSLTQTEVNLTQMVVS